VSQEKRSAGDVHAAFIGMAKVAITIHLAIVNLTAVSSGIIWSVLRRHGAAAEMNRSATKPVFWRHGRCLSRGDAGVQIVHQQQKNYRESRSAQVTVRGH